MKELEEIISDIVLNYNNMNESSNPTSLDALVTNRLKEIPDDADKYQCECGTITENEVFKYQHGKCPSCGLSLHPMNEDVSLEEKRHNCPNCKTSTLYHSVTESTTCKVCGTITDVYVPYVKK